MLTTRSGARRKAPNRALAPPQISACSLDYAYVAGHARAQVPIADQIGAEGLRASASVFPGLKSSRARGVVCFFALPPAHIHPASGVLRVPGKRVADSVRELRKDHSWPPRATPVTTVQHQPPVQASTPDACLSPRSRSLSRFPTCWPSRPTRSTGSSATTTGRAESRRPRTEGRTDVSTKSGLEEIFEEISPIEDFSGTMSLSFRDHRFEPPKNTVEECKERDFTYAAPLFVTAEFMNNETGEIKSQTVFMGDFPLMTDKGTFIVNGTERVVVSQLVRSPGVYFERSIDKTSDKDIFTAKVIPSRGAWLEFEIDKRDMVGVRLDRKRKQSVTVLLKALRAKYEDDIAKGKSSRVGLRRDHRRAQPVRVVPAHPGEGPHRRSRRRAARHLPQAASGRTPDARGGADAARELLLQPQALRPGQGRPLQDQQEARSGRGVRPADADLRRHRRRDPLHHRRCTTVAETVERAAWRRSSSSPTTSTTSATAVCARSASSSRTSSARAWPGWSAWSASG